MADASPTATKRKAPTEEEDDEQDSAKKQKTVVAVSTLAGPAAPPAPEELAVAGDAPAEFQKLPASVQQAFMRAFATGNVAMADLEVSIYDSLVDFNEDVAFQIVDSFARSALETIRNKTGYLIGILKQYRRKGQGLKAGGPTAGLGIPQMAAPQMATQQYAQAQQQYAQQMAGYQPYMQQMYPGYSVDPYTGMYTQMPQMAMPQMPQMHMPQMPQMPMGGSALAPVPPSPPVCSTLPGLSSLPASVQARLDHVFSQGQVQPTDLDASIWDSLGDFDEFTQCSIVDRFSKANLTTVRNKTGYFIGILKIYRTQQGAGGAAGGVNPHSIESYAPADIVPRMAGSAMGGRGGGFSSLPISIQYRFQELFNSGMLQPSELEDSVYDSLKDFDEGTATMMVDSFSKTNLMSVRNKTAFFIGILKRNRQGK